jgi:SNF2 family DNA or RNA helicase
MDELRALIAPWCYRVRKDEALDLPPKVYETRPVVLTPEQKRIYKELLEDGAALLSGTVAKQGPLRDVESDLWDLILDPNADKLVVKTALTNMLRRRQVLCGFVEEDGVTRWMEQGNPRLKALLDVLQDVDGKVLIWCAFKQDVRTIEVALPPGSVALFYGEVDQETRAENKRRFIEDPECRYFVGTASAGGTGVDGLTVANTVVYYSNTLRAGDRWQSEDRAHRIGQTKSVTYIDLIAEGTLDQKIVETFVHKRRQAEYLLGDGGDGA